jgi:multidrug resistance efflux pump
MDGTMESPIIATLPRGHRMDRQFGVIYDQLPSHTDDLTRIEGIRTREAVLLNQLGVYCFAQVALWRHREMNNFASELQVPLARLIDEAWVSQARALCQPVAPSSMGRPSSIFRTITILTCALMAGFFVVYLLGQHRNQPLSGVLSADITSVKVPAPARLTDVHVKAGDEVFSGQPLLTLEKLEHLAMIESHEKSLKEVERELRRLEAQAAIELEWRKKDVDRELADVRIQIAQSRGLGSSFAAQPARSSGTPVSPVSARNSKAKPARTSTPGGIMFFSRSGKVSPPGQPGNLPAPAAPVRVAEVVRDGVVSDSPQVTVDPLAPLEAEQARLQSLREGLSATVEDAIGVTNAKAQYLEARAQLENLKAASREIKVQSPTYGIVGQVRYRKGDDMPEGEIMLRILHTDRRYVMVYLPTRRVNEMSAGQEVELRFPGNDEYRGQIIEMPLIADSTTEASGESMAAVRIEPVGKVWPAVPVGSQVDVISLR